MLTIPESHRNFKDCLSYISTILEYFDSIIITSGKDRLYLKPNDPDTNDKSIGKLTLSHIFGEDFIYDVNEYYRDFVNNNNNNNNNMTIDEFLGMDTGIFSIFYDNAFYVIEKKALSYNLIDEHLFSQFAPLVPIISRRSRKPQYTVVVPVKNPTTYLPSVEISYSNLENLFNSNNLFILDGKTKHYVDSIKIEGSGYQAQIHLTIADSDYLIEFSTMENYNKLHIVTGSGGLRWILYTVSNKSKSTKTIDLFDTTDLPVVRNQSLVSLENYLDSLDITTLNYEELLQLRLVLATTLNNVNRSIDKDII